VGYATRIDLEERYGEEELAQREAVLRPGAVERALADADAEIDSYVGGRYALPLSPVPVTIVRVACAVARYYLLGDSVTEQARKGYEDARAFLRDVQAGRASLEGASELAGATGGTTVEIAGSDRLFARDVR